MLIIACVAVVAYAASVLFNTAHNSTNLSKARYIEVQFSNALATGTIKPGDPVALSPILTNNGDINCTAIIRLSIPKNSDGTLAYDYDVNSSWTLVDQTTDDSGNAVFVYGYGSEGELMEGATGGSTDPLSSGFTMKISITGAELNSMSDISL